MKRLTTADRVIEVNRMIESGQALELRKRSGLSQRDAADSCEVTQGAVHRWEQGTRRPRGRNAIAYHKLLTMLAAEVGAKAVGTAAQSGTGRQAAA